MFGGKQGVSSLGLADETAGVSSQRHWGWATHRRSDDSARSWLSRTWTQVAVPMYASQSEPECLALTSGPDPLVPSSRAAQELSDEGDRSL